MRPDDHRADPERSAWSQQQFRVTHDLSRRTNAVHLAYGEGILVCPTNAGEVLGVDLMSRSLAWAYPYREQSPADGQAGDAEPGASRHSRSAAGRRRWPRRATVANWKSAPPVIVDGKVVFTAPDANSVHCINLRDGTPVWKKRQMDGDLFLAGVFRARSSSSARNSIRALDLQTTATALVPADAATCRRARASPARTSIICRSRRARSSRSTSRRARSRPTTAPKRDDVAAGQPRLLRRRGAIARRRARSSPIRSSSPGCEVANAALQADPENPDKLVNRGELLLADGQVQAAVDDLQRALEPRTRRRSSRAGPSARCTRP